MMLPVNGDALHSEPAFVKPVHGLVDATSTNSILPANVPDVTFTFNVVPVATKEYQTSGWLFADWQPTVPVQLSSAPTVFPG